MAIWQYDFCLVPRQSVVARFGKIPDTLQDDELSSENWWAGHAPDEVAPYFDALLSRGTALGEDMDFWGIHDGNRIDVYRKGADIEEVFVRVDLRYEFRRFFDAIIDLADSQEWVIVAVENSKVLLPRPADVYADMRSSPAARFVVDPRGFFRDLQEKMDRKTSLD